MPPAQPEPPLASGTKAGEDAASGDQGALISPPTPQPDKPSGVAEAPASNAAALADAPLPPIRPVSLGKPAKHDKRTKARQDAEAAAEPPAPPPAQPEARNGQPPGNPLFRLFGDTFR